MTAVYLDPNLFNHDAQAGGFFPITHINPGFDIDDFISGNGKNILIEGIRGTGKTHILKMISSKCIDTYPEKKILPVYVSLTSLSEWQGSDIRLFRLQLYAKIVATTISTIEQYQTRMKYQKTGIEKEVERIKQMFGIKNEADINIILNKIKDLNESLLTKLTYNPQKILESGKSEVGGTVKVGAGADIIQLSFEDFFNV